MLCGRAAPAADHPQDALHLTLKQSVTSGRGRARWVSTAPALIPPAADPRSVGGTLRIIGLYQDVTVPLPAGNWSSPSSQVYRFRNKEAPAGPSPVKLALIAPGSRLTVSADTSGIDLGDPQQGTLSVALTVGGDTYCSTCTTPVKDEPGRYVAAVCEAPAVCPPPPPPVSSTPDGFRSDLMTNPTAVFTEPQTPKPAYLVTVSPGPFRTPVIPIANNPGLRTSPVTGTWGTDARHVYSTQQPWNADETLITIENRGTRASPSPLILDGSTYEPKSGPCSNYPLWDYRWHPTLAHAHEQINVTADGLELMWFDVVSCTKTRSWTLPIAASYGIGSGKGNPSNDGRFVVIAGTTRVYVVDMDPQPPSAPYPNHRIGPPRDVSDCGLTDCTIDSARISASGKYGVVFYTGDDIRVFDVDPATLALTPHAMPTSSYRCAGTAAAGYIYSLGHADVARNPFDNDEDVIVGQDECHLSGQTVNGMLIGHVLMVRLRDDAIVALTDPSNEAYADHISTRNLKRPGWAYVDYFQEDGMRFSDEVIAVKLDGSKAVQRFAHKHSVFDGCYRCESHPAPSMDGRRILFASNWAEHCGTLCGSTTDIEDYLIDARGPQSSP